MAAQGETELRTSATTVVGVALLWSGLAGAADALLLSGTQFSGPLVALRYVASAALLQALLGLPLALVVWLGLRPFVRRRSLPAALPLLAVQVAVLSLPVGMRALLWAHDRLMDHVPALSTAGVALAGLVLAATAAFATVATIGLARFARATRQPALSALGYGLAACSLLIVASGARGPAAGSTSAPSVLLISIDSVRYDTWQRYLRDHASPALRRFVAESRRFGAAHTTWSHSLASHASMLSGLYPFEHGAVLERSPDRATLGSPLAPGVELVTERLARAGYQTAAFVTNPWLGPPFGLERGFATFVNGARASRIGVWTPMLLASATLPGSYLRVARPLLQRPRHPNTQMFQDWIRRRDRGRPFFGFLHFIEMHVPHDPPARAAAAIANGRFAGVGGRELMRRVDAGEVPASELPAVIEHLHDLAVAMLSQVDAFLVPVLETLRDEGLLDTTLVILTSDHGDNLYEKAGAYGHVHVYETIAHVPLLLHVPGDSRSSQHDELVSLVDLAPTIYAFTGVPPPQHLSGVNLLDPDALADERSIFVQGGHPDGGVAHALLTEEYKLIQNPDGSRELYDRAADPSERRDLVALQPQRAAALAQQLDPVFAMAREGPEPIDVDTLPPDVVEKLRGLGYIE